MAKPKFSILSMLLAITVVGLGLALVVSRKETASATKTLEESEKLQQYLKDELGYIENDDESQMCIRSLENQVPLARRFRVDFPHGRYRVIAGNFLGGEFIRENVEAHSPSTMFFRMNSNMTIHIYKNPKGKTQFSVDVLDFNSGQSGGGDIKHNVKINSLNYSDDQHLQAVEWRIANERPHGEAIYYPAGTRFIPLFILKENISLLDENGNPKKSEGLAFWIEPVLKKKVPTTVTQQQE